MSTKKNVINIALAAVQKALENYRTSERSTVEALLAQCTAMLELKNACDTESGGSAFSELVKEELGMQQATASRMCAVASRTKLMKLLHKLPPYVNTLSQIAKLSDSEIDNAVAAGVIHPEATWRQIDAHLDGVKGKRGRSDKAVSKDPVVTTHLSAPTEEERVAFIRRVSTMLTPKLKEKWDPQDPLNHLSFLLATSQRELEAELESLPAKSQREVVHAVTRVGGYMAEVFEQHVKAETTKRLKTKEGKVDAELKKQKGITAQMQKMLKEPFDKKDFKFIRGVLHSDRPVADDRRDKAFDLFLKLAPLFAA